MTMNKVKLSVLFFLLLFFNSNNSYAQLDLLKNFSKNTDIIFSKKNIFKINNELNKLSKIVKSNMDIKSIEKMLQ